jgi:hypothetical protein
MRAVLFLSVLLLTACTGARNTVQERRIQQRRHSNGWHIDLSARQRPEPRMRIRALEPPVVGPLVDAESAEERNPIGAAEPSVATTVTAQVEGGAFVDAAPHPKSVDARMTARQDVRQEEDENIMPRKKWNALAVPAFASGLGTIALGFGTNLWLLIGAIVLTLILAGWSIKRIRRREQAGKGFAMAALLIGVFAALLTIMSIVRYGTEL